jgi:hypothetical protein
MSATLARLRKLFNDPVLIRQGRGLIPTPLAESLATPVRELLTDVETRDRERLPHPRPYSSAASDGWSSAIDDPALVARTILAVTGASVYTWPAAAASGP